MFLKFFVIQALEEKKTEEKKRFELERIECRLTAAERKYDPQEENVSYICHTVKKLLFTSVIYIVVFKWQDYEMRYRKEKRQLENQIYMAENFGIKTAHPENMHKYVGKNSTKRLLGLLVQWSFLYTFTLAGARKFKFLHFRY